MLKPIKIGSPGFQVFWAAGILDRIVKPSATQKCPAGQESTLLPPTAERGKNPAGEDGATNAKTAAKADRMGKSEMEARWRPQ